MAGAVSQVDAFRTQFRAEEIGDSYRGWWHFWFTSLVSLVVIGFSLLQIESPQPAEWLIVPAVFLYANLAEYLGHRFPMHHATRGLRILFLRHTLQHHRFFTHRQMAFDSERDFKAVLFPPVMIVFFLGVLATPMWLLLLWVATPNVAWLAVATAVGYFLNYEWLHFAYHCHPDSAIGRLGVVRRLRRLHRQHHDPSLMQRYNFNITYPICDALFGTRYRGE